MIKQLAMSLVLLLMTFHSSQVDFEYGWASRYNPGVMERVVGLRQKWGQLPENLEHYVSAIAVKNCAHIGREAVVCDEEICVLTIVGDCASTTDQQSETDLRSGAEWMEIEGIVCELGYPLAKLFSAVEYNKKMYVAILEE